MSEKTAGRELDAEIAERVMGWKCSRHYQVPDGRTVACTKDHGYLEHGAHEWARMKNYKAHEQQMIPCDHFATYSTDIGAAWTVVEKMHEMGWWMRLQSPFEADDTVWNAGFTAHSCTGWNGRPDHSGQADTAPLAICRAALKAIPALEATS